MGDTEPAADRQIADLVGPLARAHVEAELFVRSLAPYATRQTQERLIDRLADLRSAGVLDSVSIRVWGDAVRTDGTARNLGDDDTAVDRITEFFSRASDAPWSVSRYFRIVSDVGLEEGESRRRIAPPHRCLSIRRDGELAAVFPCDVADDRYTPEDVLASLEAGRPEWPEVRLAQD